MGADEILSFLKFLEYGAIGLAGLMMVLVIFAYMSKNLDEIRARVLNRFMWIGLACFVASLLVQISTTIWGPAPVSVASHQLNFSVVPDKLSEKPHSAEPELSMAGESFDVPGGITIDGDSSVLVDLTKSIANAEQVINDLNGKVEAFIKEAEKLQTAQDVVSDMESNAPSTKDLIATKALNRTITDFLRSVGAYRPPNSNE